MKRLFYTIGEPPGIFLSLLPAPQQAIMSLDYGDAMRGLYGEEVLENSGQEEWLELEQRRTMMGEEEGGSSEEFEFDDEYDQYDDDDDEFEDYDSDDEEY